MSVRFQFILRHNIKLEKFENYFVDFLVRRGDTFTVTDAVTYYESNEKVDIPTDRGVFRDVPLSKVEFFDPPEIITVSSEPEPEPEPEAVKPQIFLS